MNNKTNSSFNIFIVFLLLFISCNKSKESDKKLNQQINLNIEEFSFPDSTYIGNQTIGYLKYNLSLDSLDLSDIDERFILFHVTKDKEVESLEEIKKIKHKIFLDTIGNGVINFKMKFDNTGYNILSGIIEDKIIFKTPNENGEIRIISKETSIIKEVFISDNI